MTLAELATLDLGADAHPADVAYHVSFLRSMSQADFRRYLVRLFQGQVAS